VESSRRMESIPQSVQPYCQGRLLVYQYHWSPDSLGQWLQRMVLGHCKNGVGRKIDWRLLTSKPRELHGPVKATRELLGSPLRGGTPLASRRRLQRGLRYATTGPCTLQVRCSRKGWRRHAVLVYLAGPARRALGADHSPKSSRLGSAPGQWDDLCGYVQAYKHHPL